MYINLKSVYKNIVWWIESQIGAWSVIIMPISYIGITIAYTKCNCTYMKTRGFGETVDLARRYTSTWATSWAIPQTLLNIAIFK